MAVVKFLSAGDVGLQVDSCIKGETIIIGGITDCTIAVREGSKHVMLTLTESELVDIINRYPVMKEIHERKERDKAEGKETFEEMSNRILPNFVLNDEILKG